MSNLACGDFVFIRKGANRMAQKIQRVNVSKP